MTHVLREEGGLGRVVVTVAEALQEPEVWVRVQGSGFLFFGPWSTI